MVMGPSQQAEYQNHMQIEMLSYDEKISLAKLEESKAAERVRELEYMKARFLLDSFLAQCKAMEAPDEVKPIDGKAPDPPGEAR